MGRDDWFRRTTWTEKDKAAFFERLGRSRGAGNKAQYVRIQAAHLAQAGLHNDAIELLDLFFVEFPDDLFRAMAHHQKAQSLAATGQTEAAIEQFRLTIQAEQDRPNVRTQVWLDFPWFVATNRMRDLYDEALGVLDRHRASLLLPVEEYRMAATCALLAAEDGRTADAREQARLALAAAAKEHSGLRYHPTLGLVEEQDKAVRNRLEGLAGMSQKEEKG